MKKLFILAPFALLAGCINPTSPEEAAELTDSTLTIEEGWGRLSSKSPVNFTVTSTGSRLADTGLWLVYVRRNVDSEVFVAVTNEQGLATGTRVCLTNVAFKRVVSQLGQDGFAFAKRC